MLPRLLLPVPAAEGNTAPGSSSSRWLDAAPAKGGVSFRAGLPRGIVLHARQPPRRKVSRAFLRHRPGAAQSFLQRGGEARCFVPAAGCSPGPRVTPHDPGTGVRVGGLEVALRTQPGAAPSPRSCFAISSAFPLLSINNYKPTNVLKPVSSHAEGIYSLLYAKSRLLFFLYPNGCVSVRFLSE